MPPISVGGQIVPDAEMQLTHQNSLLLVGSWNQSSHCRFFSHANVWEVCQPVNEHGQNEGKPWRGLQYYRVFLDFSECSVIVQYMCHFLSSTVTLYTGDWCYSRVLLAFQINCRFGVQAGHWVWTCLFATYQSDRYHKRAG